jgi:hypothetical protein
MLPISYKCSCGYVAIGINWEELLSKLPHESDNILCKTMLSMVK